jgi:deoxyinosine 3'endonuclease (endonuclease V)
LEADAGASARDPGRIARPRRAAARNRSWSASIRSSRELVERPPSSCASSTRGRDGGETIGAAPRTRAGVVPVCVSIGHRVDLAIAIVLARSTRYRSPEPTRRADQLEGAG